MGGPTGLTATEVTDSLFEGRGWSPLQIGILILCSTAIMLDGMDTLMLGFVIPPLMAEWHINPGHFVPAVALTIVGMSTGTFLLGALGDRIGRRPVLIASIGLFAVPSLLMGVFATDLLSFTLLRTLGAIGLGGTFPNAIALISEFTPPHRRNSAITFAILSMAIGGLFCGLLASVLLPTFGWRSLFVAGGVLPLVMAVVMLPLIPESISFLLRTQRRDQLMATLARCRLDVGRMTIPEIAPENQQRSTFPVLLSPAFRRNTLALWLTLFTASLSAYGMFNWGPTLLVAEGFTLQRAGVALACFSFGGMTGSLIGGRLMDVYGSRWPTIAFATGGALLGLLFSQTGWPPHEGVSLLVGMVGLGICCSGLMSMLFALGSALYPPEIRGLGLGAGVGLGRLGAVGSAVFGAGVLAIHLGDFLRIWTVALLISAVGLAVIRHPGRKPTKAEQEAPREQESAA